MEQKQIDWATFATCLTIILVVCLLLAVFPGTGGQRILQSCEFIIRVSDAQSAAA